MNRNCNIVLSFRWLLAGLLALFVVVPVMADDDDEVIEKPTIIYTSMPKKYEIAGITVSGITGYGVVVK